MVRLIPRRKKAKKTPKGSSVVQRRRITKKANPSNPMENAEANGRRTHWFKRTHKQRQKIIKEK